MSIFVRPFKKEDYYMIDPIEPDTEGRKYKPEFVQAIEESGLSVTGIRNGKVVGSGGVHPMNKEQGELWLQLDKDCLNHRFDTLKWLIEGMKIIEQTYPFNQLFVYICNFVTSAKLVKYLGFKLIRVRTVKNDKWLVFSKRIRE